MLKTVILIRHGESEQKKDDPERKITPKGKRQIEDVIGGIEPLVKNKKCEIISTPTPRTVESAKIISVKLNLPFRKTFPKLRVENIKKITSKKQSSELTFAYFEKAEKGRLPNEVPAPTEIVNRFSQAISKVSKNEVLIVVGHSGALETFVNYQKLFKARKKLRKELSYGEFIVLERDR